MITTSGSQTTGTGTGYDGVVRVSTGGYYGSGVLLYDGQAILTAAHLFSSSTSATVRFETSTGTQTIASSHVLIHPDYDAANGNNDLAIVWLSQSAPLAAERSNLYRETDEVGQTLTMVGYGQVGTGLSGGQTTPTPVRSWARNRADADVGTLTDQFAQSLAWSPAAGTQLLADFDDGTTAHDALGRLLGLNNTGLGSSEGLIAPGDSGGPAFIGSAIAGIASYGAALSSGTPAPDIDNQINGTYGEIAAWQRISHFQEWIDHSLRQAYSQAPTSRADVQKFVTEHDTGTTLVFFLLEFTGMRATEDQILQVEYATRNGSATAGQDYIPTAGTLKLYAGETQAVIPVEIIGDTVREDNETFYLDVYNPVGGSFGEGVRTLTAMRTIVDDDALV